MSHQANLFDEGAAHAIAYEERIAALLGDAEARPILIGLQAVRDSARINMGDIVGVGTVALVLGFPVVFAWIQAQRAVDSERASQWYLDALHAMARLPPRSWQEKPINETDA